jgi:hypothetical protein
VAEFVPPDFDIPLGLQTPGGGSLPNPMSRHTGHRTMNGQACAHTLDQSHALDALEIPLDPGET